MAHFIEDFWTNNSNLWGNNLITRFPPEPNGRLHLGHARSIWLNMSMAKKFGGKLHLRMDDTNPEKEELSHEHAILDSLRHLGVAWDGDVHYASDHFEGMYALALGWVEKGLAFVDTSDKDTIRNMRGDLYRIGTRSVDAERPVSWHMDMLARMRAGEFSDGGPVLRARIDMASPNINLRDPVIYRIKHMDHARTGNAWCIYPTYDYAHPFCDVAEGIALSLCTLEFEDHRPLYDWVCMHAAGVAPVGTLNKPVELEFSRLEIVNGLTSKRKINALVDSGAVDGWDDPRLLTLDALARRGFPPHVLLKFIEDSGISRNNGAIPFSRLEDTLRLELDATAPRRVLVLDPVEMVIEGSTMAESALVSNHPKDPSLGERVFGLSANAWVERDDVRLPGTAEKGFKRLEVGACVRLMNMCIVTVTGVEETDGVVTRVLARETSESKPRATIHALSCKHAMAVPTLVPSIMGPDDTPDDCMPVHHAMVEPSTLDLNETFHAPRVGYAVVDSKDAKRLILTAGLKKGF